MKEEIFLLHLKSLVVELWIFFFDILVENLQEKQTVRLGKYFKLQRQEFTRRAISNLNLACSCFKILPTTLATALNLAEQENSKLINNVSREAMVSTVAHMSTS